ncbi:MAG TPA: tetratricopeptide repeat protein, partial [Vicinamibacterales bacterium]|nr:tetratricopeptide repeat protein [Vicinamibacterales bacterium]
ETVGALCLAYHADMFYTEAEHCYAAAMALEPEAWRWPYARALIRTDLGGGGEAIADLLRVIELAPDFSPAWLRLGDAEFKAGRYGAAAEAWRRAMELPEPARPARTPEHVVEVPVAAYARVGLARIALMRGDAEGARRLLEPVQQSAPAFSQALRVLADASRALGRDREADLAIYRANRLPPYAPYADPLVDELALESRNATLLLRLASEANLAVNGAWSEHLTRRALAFDPDNPEAIAKLGRVLRTVGRSAEALPYFRRYHELVPGDFEGLAQIGATLSDLGRYEEAEPLLRRALEGIDDAVTHYNLGLLLATTGRLEEAVAAYRKALERDPRNSNARVNLAATLARQGHVAAAIAELERVVADDPEHALAQANLGLLLAGRGARARAIAHLREAVRLDPDLRPAADALRQLGG